MAFSKLLIACFLLSALLLTIVQAQQPKATGVVYTPPPPKQPGAPIDCKAACLVRCSKTKRPKLCQRACGSCCKKCNCVPPGTYGNYHTCLCYASLTTTGGRKKCP
ncbi:unnamed protein product [Amaranthus hypochondriacus]